MEPLIIIVVGLLVISAIRVIAPRLRVAAPLLLVLVGIIVSFLPFIPAIEVNPEWILAGILPPLLYAAAVSVPTMEFRRDFSAISGLSVILVLVSAVLLGLLFSWIIPDLTLWCGIALGAIISPTDAVATSIVRHAGVSGRTVTMLEGESLLNDATALVLLRTAVAGAAASIGFWSAVGDFAFAVVVALVLGFIVGHLNLRVRAMTQDSTVNTVLSLSVPFLASIPAELLGASGLFAAVVAGLVTGHGAPAHLSPRHRLSDHQVWRAVELVLESSIFLLMGLELFAIVTDVREQHGHIMTALLIAALGLIGVLLIRAGYVAILMLGLRRRARRREHAEPHLKARQQRRRENAAHRGRQDGFEGRIASVERRLLADIEYLRNTPFGWREGGVLIWAGMRGAITLAAAQTLPPETPHRSLLILVAFCVAAGSLLVQGSTLGPVVRWLRPATASAAVLVAEREELRAVLKKVGQMVSDRAHVEWISLSQDASGSQSLELQLTVIEAQREALLSSREEGRFSSEVLEHALASLDADQIRIELKTPDDGRTS